MNKRPSARLVSIVHCAGVIAPLGGLAIWAAWLLSVHIQSAGSGLGPKDTAAVARELLMGPPAAALTMARYWWITFPLIIVPVLVWHWVRGRTSGTPET